MVNPRAQRVEARTRGHGPARIMLRPWHWQMDSVQFLPLVIRGVRYYLGALAYGRGPVSAVKYPRVIITRGALANGLGPVSAVSTPR